MTGIRRNIILLVMLLISLPTAFATLIDDFAESPAINASQTAVMITDLNNGKTIVAHNSNLPLIPASIMKSVTTATLLNKAGHSYRYITPVSITGELKSGILHGNIEISASGDPTIGSVNKPESADFIAEIVCSIENLGIKEITGDIIIDESKFPGPTINPRWATGDLPHAYGTGTHGFNFEDNASGKKSVSNPSGVFKSRLKSALRRSGISIADNPVDAKKPGMFLLNHESAELDEIMRSCMMRSDNQMAEAFMRQVGLQFGGTGSTEKGTQETKKYWSRQGADMTGVEIFDGSGLSRSNRVTAKFMTDMLCRMSSDPWYASLFPLAGMEGTLQKFLLGTELEGYIAMKTGSMSGIQCYAGYKLDDNYKPTHSVVIIMNNMANRSAARKEVEKLLLGLFSNNNPN